MATSTIEVIDRLVKPTQQFTRGWMLVESTAKHGEALGFASGRHYWVVGRAGVLGECTAETAIAALGFHGPDLIRTAWADVPDGMTHYDTSLSYAQRAIEWGERELTVFDPDRLERLDGYTRRIIDAAPTSLGAIFAGWRALPTPDSVGGRVGLTTQVFREMRGAAHLIAVISVGLTPLDAILASTNAPPRTGPGYAEQMGFTGPFRDPEEVRARRLDAERITSRILEPFYDVLDADELADFAELFESTRNAIDM
ncbi:MAG: helix-turn-helix domain-containing protein [Acidimicrobiales bacterium]